ncbi:Hydrogen cyanide synthase subunit HcnC precursor [Arthrobacter ulcerisalmonis]|uniref:Hydrogen cyanide synthase subunit HcnC n=1 Tax=Arthrobacter ulcerisalmonis TaxID=2483813 RepID=A0A3P5XN98_9MICC|nr:FAD-dependent oxidoreductase [Arthrobacter ulcerisalmonis]VDC30192.1 Hydrogen cyanide synthase subunit HcnC precursor [Arthrobacter ulcerisalmonis]
MAAYVDVLIVGGGIAGLSLAAELAQHCTVALVEAEQELAYHTSSRSARQLIPSYGPPVVQELTRDTLALIAADDAESQHPVLTPRSFMLIGTEAGVAAHGSDQMEPVTIDEALRLCPALLLDSFAAAGLDTGSFGCDAPLLLERHRHVALAAGAEIFTGARVHSAQRLGSGWRVGAGVDGFDATVVVNAAGAWADELAVISGVEKLGLQPYRRTAAIAAVDHPLPAQSPMVAAADDSFYFRPDGGDVLISPSETVPSGPEDAKPRAGDVERLVDRLNNVTVLGITGVRRAWTGLRTEAADGIPVAGFDAEATGFYWLAGQGGYGFQTSAAMAQLAAGQIRAHLSGESRPESQTTCALAATRWSNRR